MSIHEHTCSGYDGTGPSPRGCEEKISCTEPKDPCQLVYLCGKHAPKGGSGPGLRTKDDWEAIINGA